MKTLAPLIVLLISAVCPYNLDTNHAIIVQNPDKSEGYFGYSLVLYRNSSTNGTGWLKIGAPKASHSTSNLRSGLVYHCPFMQTCYVDDDFNYFSNELNNSWIGGAMDVNLKYNILGVSASRWQKPHAKKPLIPGGFFMENLGAKRLEDVYCPLKKPQYENDLPYYARGLAGSSLHFPEGENEVFLGAPAVYNFLGTAFRVQNIDQNKEKWMYQIISPSGFFYEYSGYAVTSGRYYRKNELLYVSGLPKGSDKLTQARFGAVMIFTFGSSYLKFQDQVKTNRKEIIYGDQFGEYFGSALASGDLDKDGLDDLIVGAPFRCNDDRGYNHGSVYIFYGNHVMSTISNKYSSSRLCEYYITFQPAR